MIMQHLVGAIGYSVVASNHNSGLYIIEWARYRWRNEPGYNTCDKLTEKASVGTDSVIYETMFCWIVRSDNGGIWEGSSHDCGVCSNSEALEATVILIMFFDVPREWLRLPDWLSLHLRLQEVSGIGYSWTQKSSNGAWHILFRHRCIFGVCLPHNFL